MPVSNADIEEVKKEIEKSEKALCGLYTDLGSVACNYHQAINCTQSNGVFADICDVSERRDEIVDRMDEIKGVVNTLTEKDRSLEQTSDSIRKMDERLDTLIDSLGAVATEMYSAGFLPSEFEAYMKPFIEYEKNLKDIEDKLDSSRNSSWRGQGSLPYRILERKLERYRSSINSIFSECGKRLYNSNALGRLPGERATEISSEIFEIKEKRKNYRKKIGDAKTSITRAQESLKGMGVSAAGEEKVTLRDLEERLRGVNQELDGLYEKYGRIISPEMDRWLDDMAPEELKKACRHIKNEQKVIRQQNIKVKYLELEQQIEANTLHKSQFEAQVAQMEKQKALIEKQIVELQSKSEIEQRKIADLRQQQVELNIEFRSL
ncbi:MAG: hypothetical protein K5634_01700 [Sphaerochaetaceae bacterium]|nr:hypothetical protein [Sphaerochaetaceae bacterium]